MSVRLAVFGGDSARLVGKLRVRMGTLAPGAPVNARLPLQGERAAGALGFGGFGGLGCA